MNDKLDCLPKPSQLNIMKLIKNNKESIIFGVRWDLNISELFEETKKAVEILTSRISQSDNQS